ncbi:MAG: gliding motility-associated C-terminal domain-containing protein [Chitinophagia bacterium]|nr:gliding motility-associated C-terminal domain-containing protein [Chitinophagia bacterium]
MWVALEPYNHIKWITGDGDSTVNKREVFHAYLTPGSYNITLSTHYPRCGDAAIDRSVLVYPAPVVALGHDTGICSGSINIVLSDEINAGNSHASWLWSTGATTHAISVNVPGVYYVITTIDGCQTSDSVVISDDCYIDMPNAFSPNGDGLNETFLPRPLLSKGLKTFLLRIFDRWGQEVFNTNKLEGAGWDGKYNGVAQPEGVYIYMVEATFIDGGKETRHGNLTLLR